jgi:hypothetical protein
MDLTPDQIEELFVQETPDVQICLHEIRIQPVKLGIDGVNRCGYVARMLGHAADEKPMTIDFITTEPVLQETMTRILEAGMTAAFMNALTDSEESGDPTQAVALLVDLAVRTSGVARNNGS